MRLFVSLFEDYSKTAGHCSFEAYTFTGTLHLFLCDSVSTISCTFALKWLLIGWSISFTSVGHGIFGNMNQGIVLMVGVHD